MARVRGNSACEGAGEIARAEAREDNAREGAERKYARRRGRNALEGADIMRAKART